jgi:hypothetical protein
VSGAFGYSGKSLIQKLGVRDGDRMAVINAPAHYAELVAPFPRGAEWVEGPDSTAGVIHLFVRDRADLQAGVKAVFGAAPVGGRIWISWPKKSSKLFVDLTEDGVREIVLPTGWVDVKVCAVDADWSGLKFLRRRE